LRMAASLRLTSCVVMESPKVSWEVGEGLCLIRIY